MSGHSKWSTIKRKKGAADAKRSKVFSRLSKEIQVAVKEGGADESGNPRLRLAIQNAKGVNMPKDNIQRAIAKANSEGQGLHEVSFEGYAPGGVALFIECTTDNHNRVVGNIKSLFNKHGGSLGTHGSLGFMFERKGVITLKKEGLDLESLELEMIEAGAEDLSDEGEIVLITTSLQDFIRIRRRLEEIGIEPENAELHRIPHERRKVLPKEGLKILKMIEELEEDEDVNVVFHNLELTEELWSAMQ